MSGFPVPPTIKAVVAPSLNVRRRISSSLTSFWIAAILSRLAPVFVASAKRALSACSCDCADTRASSSCASFWVSSSAWRSLHDVSTSAAQKVQQISTHIGANEKTLFPVTASPFLLMRRFDIAGPLTSAKVLILQSVWKKCPAALFESSSMYSRAINAGNTTDFIDEIETGVRLLKQHYRKASD